MVCTHCPAFSILLRLVYFVGAAQDTDIWVATAHRKQGSNLMGLVIRTTDTPLEGSGSRVTKALYEALSQNGPIEGFEAGWYPIEGLSDNLDIFNRNLRNRLSLEDAARRTPTGNMVKHLGFTRVEIPPFILDPDNGALTIVDGVTQFPNGLHLYFLPPK
jgi:hypothetical protein